MSAEPGGAVQQQPRNDAIPDQQAHDIASADCGADPGFGDNCRGPGVQIAEAAIRRHGRGPRTCRVSRNADGVRSVSAPRARRAGVRMPDGVPCLVPGAAPYPRRPPRRRSAAASQVSIPSASISLQVSIERPADLAPFERKRASALGAERATGRRV